MLQVLQTPTLHAANTFHISHCMPERLP